MLNTHPIYIKIVNNSMWYLFIPIIEYFFQHFDKKYLYWIIVKIILKFYTTVQVFNFKLFELYFSKNVLI